MFNLNPHFTKLFALSSLSLLLAACGGGGDGGNSSGDNTTAPITNPDLFTIKGKTWTIQPTSNTSYCYDIVMISMLKQRLHVQQQIGI